MIFLGLDIATNTGWAYYDTSKPMSAIRAGSFKCEGGSPEEKAYHLSAHLIRLFRMEGKPGFVVIEEPMKVIPRLPGKAKFMGEEEAGGPVAVGNATTMVLLNQLAGSAIGLLRGYGLPFEAVPVSTWRSSVYGFGRKKGWSSPDWKRHAKKQCEMVKVHAPNADAAEAVWIAHYGPNCQRAKMQMMEQAA